MNFKWSFYNVSSDAFVSKLSQKANRIVFNTASLAKTIVPDEDFEKLLLGKFDFLPESQIEFLKQNGFIVPSEQKEIERVLSENKNAIEDETVFNLVIQTSGNCQMGCHYCGQAHSATKLSTDRIEKLLQHAKEKLQTKKFKHLGVGWFGGEPLLGMNELRTLSRELKKIAAENNCTFSSRIATNGLLLNVKNYRILTEECGVSRIEVTLDGDAPFHDARRILKKGGATFDIIIKNLIDIRNHPDCSENDCLFAIRCNVDRDNASGVLPLIQRLYELGLHKRYMFYTAQVHSWGNDAHLAALTKSDYADIEIEWVLEMIKLGFLIPSLVPGRKKVICLAVSKTGEVVDASGKIYDCTEVPLVPAYDDGRYLIGDLDSKSRSQFSDRTFTTWNESILTDSESQCHNCKMLPVCGGACPKAWLEGSIPCPSAKFNIGDKLLLDALINKQ